jgi:hypothetical protein
VSSSASSTENVPERLSKGTFSRTVVPFSRTWPTGVLQSTFVSDWLESPVADWPPNFTASPEVFSRCPVTDTAVPPAIPPVVTSMESIRGVDTSACT